MLNSNLLKFIIKNNLEESAVAPKKEPKIECVENKMYAYSKFATVPIQVLK